MAIPPAELSEPRSSTLDDWVEGIFDSPTPFIPPPTELHEVVDMLVGVVGVSEEHAMEVAPRVPIWGLTYYATQSMLRGDWSKVMPPGVDLERLKNLWFGMCSEFVFSLK